MTKHFKALRNSYLPALLLILVCGTSQAQVKQNYYQYGGKWKRLQADSALKIPMVSVGVKDANAGLDSAQLRYNPTDSTVEVYTGNQWIKAVRSTGGGSGGVDSIWRVPGIDSFFYSLNGVDYKIKDSTGGSGSTNSNIGSGYRLAVPGTNNIKTLFPGLYAYADSSSNTNGITVGIDSSALFAYGLRRKDSVAGGYYPYSSNPRGYLTTNIYNSDGTLSGTRTVTTGGNEINFYTDASNYFKYTPSTQGVEALMTNGNYSTYFNVDAGNGVYMYGKDATVSGNGGFVSAYSNGTELELSYNGNITGLLNNYKFGRVYSLLATENPYVGVALDSANGVLIGRGTTTNRHDLIRGLRVLPDWQIYMDSIDAGGTANDSVLVVQSDGKVVRRNASAFGGSTPTLQQVLTAGSTLTTSNTIDANGNNFSILNSPQITIYSEEGGNVDIGGSNTSQIVVGDGIELNAYLGNISADTLTSGASTDSVIVWNASTKKIGIRNASSFGGSYTASNGLTLSGSNFKLGGALGENTQIALDGFDLIVPDFDNFADTTNWKPVVVNTTGSGASAGTLRKATYWPVGSGGGGSPAGNYGNLQINRNGAFATPGSDSLDFEASTGLEIKAPLTFRSASLYGTNLTVKDQGGTTRWFSYIDGGNSPVFQGPPYWRFLDGANEYFRIEGNDASSTSASVQVRTVVSGKAGVRVDLAGSATNDAFQVYNSGANKIFNVTSEGGIDLYNYGTAPSASVTNGIRLYAEDVSSSAELKVRDEASNITTLSPHNFGKIPGGRSEKMAWSFYSERNGEYITADMTKALRTIEKQSAEIEELKAQIAELRGEIYKKKKPVKIVYTGKK